MSLQDDNYNDINASENVLKMSIRDLVRKRLNNAQKIRQENLDKEAERTRKSMESVHISRPQTSSSFEIPLIQFLHSLGEGGLVDKVSSLISNTSSNAEIEASLVNTSFGKLTVENEQYLTGIPFTQKTEYLSIPFEELIARRIHDRSIIPDVSTSLSSTQFNLVNQFFERYAKLNEGQLLKTDEHTIVDSIDQHTDKLRKSLRRITNLVTNEVQFQEKTKLDSTDFTCIGVRVRESSEVLLKNSAVIQSQFSLTSIQRNKNRISYTSNSQNSILKPNLRVDLTKVTSPNTKTRYEIEVEIVDIEYAKLNPKVSAIQFLETINLLRNVLNGSEYLLYDSSLIPSEIEKAYVKWRFGRCFTSENISYNGNLSSLPFVQNRPVNLKLNHFYDNQAGKPIIHQTLTTIKVDGHRAFVSVLDSGVYLCEGRNSVTKLGACKASKTEFILDTEVVRLNRISKHVEISIPSSYGKIPSTNLSIFVFDIVFSSLTNSLDRGDQLHSVVLTKTLSNGSTSFIGIGDRQNYQDFRHMALLDRIKMIRAISSEHTLVDPSGGGYYLDTVRACVQSESITFYPKPYYMVSERASIYDRVNKAFDQLSYDGKWKYGKKFEQDGLIFQDWESVYSNTSTFKWKPREKVTIDFLVKETVDTSIFNLYVENSDGVLVVFDKCPEYVNSNDIITFQDGHSLSRSEFVGNVVEFAFDSYSNPIPYRIREDKAGHPNKFNVANDNYNDVKNPIEESTIRGRDTVIMRRIHNREKEVMLSNFLSNTKSFLFDIGSGRGGDLAKWKRLPEKISKVLCIEPDSNNIEELEKRAANLAMNNYECIQAGAETSDLFSRYLEGSSVNVTSFFSLTFFFKDEKLLEGLLKNLQSLPEGSVFFGIVLDGDRVHKLLGDNNSFFDCDSFSIKGDYENKILGEVGCKIITSLKDSTSMVKEVEEYLVFFPLLVRKLASIGYTLIANRFLEGDYVKTKADNGDKTIEQINPLYSNMPHNSLIFSSLNRAFVFKRVSETDVKFDHHSILTSTFCKYIDYNCSEKKVVLPAPLKDDDAETKINNAWEMPVKPVASSSQTETTKVKPVASSSQTTESVTSSRGRGRGTRGRTATASSDTLSAAWGSQSKPLSKRGARGRAKLFGATNKRY